MLNTFVHRVKRCRNLRFPGEFILLTSILSAQAELVTWGYTGHPGNSLETVKELHLKIVRG